jgi:hypothetical protein
MTVASSSCRPGRCTRLAQRQSCVLDRFEHAERLVGVKDQFAWNRVLVAGLLGAHLAILLVPIMVAVDGRRGAPMDRAFIVDMASRVTPNLHVDLCKRIRADRPDPLTQISGTQ